MVQVEYTMRPPTASISTARAKIRSWILQTIFLNLTYDQYFNWIKSMIWCSAGADQLSHLAHQYPAVATFKCNSCWQQFNYWYKNVWPDGARFGPTLAIEVFLRQAQSETKWDHHFLALVQLNKTLVWFVYRQWCVVSEHKRVKTQFISLRHCKAVGYSLVLWFISEPPLLFDRKRSVKIDVGVLTVISQSNSSSQKCKSET